MMNKGQECSIACNCPKQSHKENKRRGFPDEAKKRKKTESNEEKKFLSARKKLSTQECGKQKKGVSHGLCDAQKCSRSFIGFKQSGNHLTRNIENLLLSIRREIIDENKGEQMSEDKHAYM